MQAAALGETSQKFLLYSGHDTTSRNTLPVVITIVTIISYQTILLIAIFLPPPSLSLSPVIPILTALQVDEGVWPPYASMMLLELYQFSSNGSLAVRLLYNGATLYPPFCQPSSSLCDFDTFSVYLKTVTPSDPKAQCAT